MHLRVQGLDPAIHHFREAGQLADVLHRQAGIAQGLGGAAGGDQGHAVAVQRLRQRHQAGLVGNGKQGAADAAGFAGGGLQGHGTDRLG